MDTTPFDRQLGDLLLIVTISLRSGYRLRQVIEFAAGLAPEPTGGLLKQGLTYLEDGDSYDEAFARLLEDCPSPYLAQFVDAVRHHQEVGGNLAIMLDEVGQHIREQVESDGALFPYIRDLCVQVGARVPDYVQDSQH